MCGLKIARNKTAQTHWDTTAFAEKIEDIDSDTFENIKQPFDYLNYVHSVTRLRLKLREANFE